MTSPRTRPCAACSERRSSPEIDLFDRAQLAKVVVCRASPSASAAGRKLFGVSRLAKSSANDADRLRKYLARFDLSFDEVKKPALT